jgi:hypothetical protein
MEMIEGSARPARFVGRFVFHDEPQVLEALERVAASHGVSVASVVRSAIRMWLREYGAESRRSEP